MSRNQRYLLANEAGQKATIDTVTALTGVRVDHFAEVNLAGFYELAKAFHGIEVCVKSWNRGQNLNDTNSGFHQKHAGYLHLEAGQTLAFVRERDNLPNGDLDRTHRQQAVIDYVIWKLEHQGFLTSIGHLTSLLDLAKKYHDHRLGLADTEFRQRHEEPDREQPDLHDGAGDHHGRPGRQPGR